jgi:16S rRNA (adenine1518-N6/adenine1519-N6)-dimethyltransferase
VQYFSEPQVLFYISKNSFLPAPKVDSAFLKIRIKKPLLNEKQEKKFISIIRAAFSQRRKTILNAISASFSFSKERMKEFLIQSHIAPTLRPEAIPLDSYLRLVKLLKLD